MARYAYRLWIWVLAIVVVASGSVWQPCAAAQSSIQASVHASHAHRPSSASPAPLAAMHDGAHYGVMQDDASHAHMMHHAMSEDLASSQDAIHHTAGTTAPAPEHGCQKNCGLCALASVPAKPPGSSVVRVSSHVVFLADIPVTHRWHAFPDPEIPKPLV